MSKLLITGTNFSDKTHTKFIFEKIYAIINNKTDNGDKTDEIIQGASKGVELVSLLSSFYLREGIKKDLSDFKLTTVLEDSLDKCYKDKKDFITRYSDDIIEMKNDVSPHDNYQSFKLKNIFMVQRCTDVLAIMTKENSYSRTALAILNIAKKENKLIHKFYID